MDAGKARRRSGNTTTCGTLGAVRYARQQAAVVAIPAPPRLVSFLTVFAVLPPLSFGPTTHPFGLHGPQATGIALTRCLATGK